MTVEKETRLKLFKIYLSLLTWMTFIMQKVLMLCPPRSEGKDVLLSSEGLTKRPFST